MVEKTKSTTSIGFGSEIDISIPFVRNALSFGHYLHDICVFVIKCQHNQMPVFSFNDKSGLWLPYVRLTHGQKWLYSVQSMSELFIKDRIKSPIKHTNLSQTEKVIIDLNSIELLSISRLQLPQEEYISRIVFRAKWSGTGGMVCCKDTELFKWHSIDHIIKGTVNGNQLKLWGSEVSQMATLLNKNELELIDENLMSKELTTEEYLKYAKFDTIDDKNHLDSKDEDNGNQFIKVVKEFVQKSGINNKVLEKLYSDFIQHCYPAFNMSFTSFRQYIEKMELIKMEDKAIQRGFVAMNFSQTGYLTFQEFLIGLAVLDPKSPEGEMRSESIFRYYDSNSDGFLERSDFKNMVIDMKKQLNQSIDKIIVDKEVNQIVKGSNEKMSYEFFLSVIKSSKLIETSVLFRSLESLHKLISKKNIYEPIVRHSKSLVQSQERAGNCPKCKVKDYKLAVHTLKLNSNGRLSDPQNIQTTDKNEIVFKVEDESIESNRRHSIITTNNNKSIANQVIASIRELGKVLKSDSNEQMKREFQTMTSRVICLDVIKDICDEVIHIFKCESRVVKVQSPVYVLGDIHGNLQDLITFEEQLWRTAPQCMPTNLLFTGDYVDRGKYGIECILYLYCLKILNPIQVFLLRGNHEIRTIQKQFTFERECKLKYHLKDGQKVFELLNNTFDVLPIAGIVDESIFCAHGGIPYSLTTIAELMQIPSPLKNPEQESEAAWEILWSDPIDEESYDSQRKFAHQTEDTGFVRNMKRSTAYCFAQKAVDNFLSVNQLSHIIRAHEMAPEGYELHLNGKVLTIFSCSRYCGQTNKAATVQIDGTQNDGSIKIIQLET